MNKLKGEVEITLDRVRKIRLDANSICEAEATVGGDLVTKSYMDYGLRGIRAVLYHGLKGDDPALTLVKVGELMNERPLPEINALVLKAWNLALLGEEAPKADASPNEVKPAPDGAGETS